MIEAIELGRVHGKPAQRASKTGAAFSVAKLRVASSASESLFTKVTAFSDFARAAMLALDDGDATRLGGTTAARPEAQGISTPPTAFSFSCRGDYPR